MILTNEINAWFKHASYELRVEYSTQLIATAFLARAMMVDPALISDFPYCALLGACTWLALKLEGPQRNVPPVSVITAKVNVISLFKLHKSK